MEKSGKKDEFKDLFDPVTNAKAALIITTVGTFVFFSSLFNSFVYDDEPQIVINPLVQSLTNIPRFFVSSIIQAGIEGVNLLDVYYKPIPFTIYTIVHSVFGANPFLFHLPQVLLHMANTFLIFLLFSSFFKRPLAFFLAVVFLVHPLNSESVVYIANLQDTLFLFFGLASTYLIVRSRDTVLSNKNHFLISFLLLLSIMSKETGILFFFIVPAYTLFFAFRHFKRIILAIASSLAVYILFRFLSLNNEAGISVPSLIQQSDLTTRLISMPQIAFYYISKLFVPINFAVGQEWLVKSVGWQSFYLPLILDTIFFAITILGGVLLFLRRRSVFKAYLFFALWFFLGLSIHLQIFPLDVTVADRWFYFPMVGLLGLVGVFANGFIGSVSGHKANLNILVLTGLFLIVVLSVLTIVRSSQFRTPLTLYAHDLQYSRVSPQIDNLYGRELMKSGKVDEAKFYLEKSVTANPRLGNNLQHLGLWYELKKEYTEAKELYWQDVNLNNGLPKSYSYASLAGIALYNENNPHEAKELTETGLSKYPQYERLLEYSAIAEYLLENKKKSLMTAQKLVGFYPSQKNGNLLESIKNDSFKLQINDK